MTVPQRLSFSAQLTNCNVGPCWHIDLSILGLLLSISIHLRKSFSCCMRFFQKNDPWAGLGRILRNHRKTLMSSVHLCLFSWEIRLVLNTDVNDWKLMSFCHGNENQGIDPNILSSGHHKSWLFHKGCLSTKGFPKQTCINSAPALGGACAMGTSTIALIQTS